MDTVEKRKKLFERACEGFLNALYIEKERVIILHQMILM